MGGVQSEPLISVRGVSKSYARRKGEVTRSVPAVSDVEFDVHRLQFVTLLGPSGCGKTTLLKIMGGLIGADSGEVRIDGRRVTHPPEGVGFVFQNFGLLPWRTVLGNVEFGLEGNKLSRQERRDRSLQSLELVGLKDFISFHPHELSGGMQQRVGLARALVTQPRVLLMDEPFGALDAYTRELMQVELLRIIEQQQVAVVFVTHSLDEAVLLSDSVVLLTPRPGRIQTIIPVDLPRPRNEHVRSDSRFTALRERLWTLMRSAEMRPQPVHEA